MIVLDEQLKDPPLRDAIERWHPVKYINELCRNQVIKDEHVVAILRREQPYATFVTLNHDDFWGKMEPDRKCCIVCLNLPTAHRDRVPDLLRRLFQLSEFHTAKQRCGKVIRATANGVQYYTQLSRFRKPVQVPWLQR